MKSGIAFGTIGGILFLYVTDWKVVMSKVPIYNIKFRPKETEEEE